MPPADRRDTDQVKANGVFYTPGWLVERVLERALEHARRSFPTETLLALDPACGEGAFTRRLPPDVRTFGVDVDAAAAARAGCHRVAIGDAIVDEPGVADIEPLRWRRAFPDVLDAGGFHLVVGNPPWRNIDAAMPGDDARRHLAFKRWLQGHRPADPGRLAWAGRYRRMCDLYHLFVYRALWALRPGGVLAFVLSRSWLEGWYADELREALSRETTLLHVWDLGAEPVFDSTDTPAAVLICAKGPPPPDHRVDVAVQGERRAVPQCELSGAPWRFRAQTIPGSVRLGDLCQLSQGMQTGCNAVFANLTDADVERLSLEREHLFRRAAGADIRAGRLTDRRPHWVIWTEDVTADSLPPGIARHLGGHRATLEQRAAFRRGSCEWFRWTWPRPGQLGRPKLLCPYRASSNRFWFDASGDTVGLTDTTVLLPHRDSPLPPADLADRLNDEEHTRRQQSLAKVTGPGLWEYFATQLQDLPVSW